MTEISSKFVAKRYAAERRFRIYGAAALAITALFLAFLVVDVVGKGTPAFHQVLLLDRVHFINSQLGFLK